MQLEERAGRPIHEMFDIIGGTSTGGILATALGVRKASLLEAEEIYRCRSCYAASEKYGCLGYCKYGDECIIFSYDHGAGSFDSVLITDGRDLSTELIWRMPCLDIYKPLHMIAVAVAVLWSPVVKPSQCPSET